MCVNTKFKVSPKANTRPCWKARCALKKEEIRQQLLLLLSFREITPSGKQPFFEFGLKNPFLILHLELFLPGVSNTRSQTLSSGSTSTQPKMVTKIHKARPTRKR
jgi:hypothetical protein